MGMDILRKQLEVLHDDSFMWSLQCCRGDYDEASDVLQCVYEKVVTGRAVFGGRSKLKTWVFSVIAKTAAQRFRKRSRRSVLLRMFTQERAEAISPQIAVERQELRDVVLSAMAGLSPRQKTVLELVFYHDLTVAEAAEVMEVTVGTARVHYDRAKKELRKRLEESGGEHAMG
jgi:RNA polymerase sigma factor (sigma-70 family)